MKHVYTMIVDVPEVEDPKPIQLVKGYDGVYYTWDEFMCSKWGWKNRLGYNLTVAIFLVALGCSLEALSWAAKGTWNYFAGL